MLSNIKARLFVILYNFIKLCRTDDIPNTGNLSLFLAPDNQISGMSTYTTKSVIRSKPKNECQRKYIFNVDKMRVVLGFLFALILPALPLLAINNTESRWLLQFILFFTLLLTPIIIPTYLALLRQQTSSFSNYLKSNALICLIPVTLLFCINLILGNGARQFMPWLFLMLMHTFCYGLLALVFFWFFVVKKRELISLGNF